MKKILIGLTVIVLLVVGVLVYIYVNLDSIVKTTIEQAGSRVTQVEVTVGGIDIQPTQNSAEIKGLKIGNPKGFKTDEAFSLGDVQVVIDGSSLTSGTIHVKRVVVDKPSVTYELAQNTSNIATIQRNVESFVKGVAGSGAGKDGSADQGTKAANGEGTKVIIDEVLIAGGKVNVSASLLQGKSLSTGLPDIRLRDIGKDKGGATPAQVAEKILTALNTSVFKSVSKLNVDGLMQGVGDLGKGVADQLGNTVKDGGAIKDGANALGDKVKGLFGGSSSSK